jgi:hypothetical protein
MGSEFLRGLIFGAGFSIAAVVLSAVAMFAVPWDKAFASQTSQIVEETTKAFASAEGVKVLTHESTVRGEDVIFLGKLKNEGQSTARNFSIEVELFDKDKKFVDVCRESFYTSNIRPGEERNFKVSCGGCRSRPVTPPASYSVRVVTGI